jgi:hypothetical protein
MELKAARPKSCSDKLVDLRRDMTSASLGCRHLPGEGVDEIRDDASLGVRGANEAIVEHAIRIGLGALIRR